MIWICTNNFFSSFDIVTIFVVTIAQLGRKRCSIQEKGFKVRKRLFGLKSFQSGESKRKGMRMSRVQTAVSPLLYENPTTLCLFWNRIGTFFVRVKFFCSRFCLWAFTCAQSRTNWERVVKKTRIFPSPHQPWLGTKARMVLRVPAVRRLHGCVVSAPTTVSASAAATTTGW